MNLTERIRTLGIVPVVRLDRAEDGPGLAKALCEGGLPCAEVTFRTEAAEEGMRLMKESCPDLLIGAGTVLSIEQVDRAVGAGAEFIVSPGGILCGAKDPGFSRVFQSQRCGAGDKISAENSEDLPVRGNWRTENDQGAGRTLRPDGIYAHWRNRKRKYPGVSVV